MGWRGEPTCEKMKGSGGVEETEEWEFGVALEYSRGMMDFLVHRKENALVWRLARLGHALFVYLVRSRGVTSMMLNTGSTLLLSSTVMLMEVRAPDNVTEVFIS